MKPKLINKMIAHFSKILDNQMVYIKKLRDGKSTLEKSLASVVNELAKEQELISYNVELRQCFAMYYQVNMSRQEALEMQIQAQQKQIDSAEEALIQIKTEQKKFEKMLENHNLQVQFDESKQETKQLDEFNVIKYRS